MLSFRSMLKRLNTLINMNEVTKISCYSQVERDVTQGVNRHGHPQSSCWNRIILCRLLLYFQLVPWFRGSARSCHISFS